MNDKILNKKILLITYHFPPSLAVGGFRIKGFSRHLPQNGWEPYVLTIRENLSENNDDSSLEGINSIRVFRTGTLPALIDVYICFKFLIKRILRRNAKTVNIEQNQTFIKKETLRNESLFEKWKRYFNSVVITLPDKERNWIIPAVFKATQLIKQEEIQYILTSSPPHSVQIIGLILKKLTHIKWIVDFRDPWMTPYAKYLKPNSQLSYRIERWIEKKVVRNADLVLTTTPMLKNAFIKKYHTLSKEKFACYSNGFDEEIFVESSKLKKNDIFTIVYIGSIYFGRSPEPLFKAIKELIKEKKLRAEQIRIDLVGNCQYINDQLTSEVAAFYGLGTIVNISGYISRSEALKIVQKSHVALLMAIDQPYQIPAKVFEYLGGGTRILALTQKGATSDLVEVTKSGKAIDPSNIDGIKNFIYKEFLNAEKNVNNSGNNYDQYNRRNIVRDLANHLNQI